MIGWRSHDCSRSVEASLFSAEGSGEACITRFECFSWQLCSHLVNLSLGVLVTSASAVWQYCPLMTTAGQSRPVCCCFPLPFLSVSLLPSGWKSHPSIFQEIPLCPESVADGGCEGAAEQFCCRGTLGCLSFCCFSWIVSEVVSPRPCFSWLVFTSYTFAALILAENVLMCEHDFTQITHVVGV